ncbi:hypothetical protein M407DRAFT_23630 [Tulasnella calospora MUT 4182]|uniref:Uncharacterized protein n=1 Tax=Tulasnella calospora MUT 4182 TaxID=1051891 RepID=A0A0C3L093_9AGAM|nr:hypothetical protein M407DRAFT_23630 [Tulasnella calospora MUT 4182]
MSQGTGETTVVIFRGKNGKECDSFIRYIRQAAFEREKHRDYEWMAGFASSLYSGRALRWHSKLEDDVRENWKLLEREMIEEFGVAESEGSGGSDSEETSYRPRLEVEAEDGISSRGYHSDFDAATTAARSPAPSTASTPLPGRRKVLRDPTGSTGFIQVVLTGPPSSLSEAAKTALNPARVWYLGREPKEDDGRLSLTNNLGNALHVKFENQHVLKITNATTKYQWLGIRWMYSEGPRIALESTHHAVLVSVDGVDSKNQTCSGSNLAVGQISHTSWALAGRNYEIMSKWARPVQDRQRLGHMADLPTALNLHNGRLVFLAGRLGDFFNAMGGDNYASVVSRFQL